MTRRGALALPLWLIAVAAAALIVARAHYTADLTAFLPRAPTPQQRLLVDQLRAGPASRLVLIAIVGGDSAARARASRSLLERLRADPAFASIGNGESLASDRDFLLAHRYLLSAAVEPQRFTVEGLHAAIGETIDLIASPAGFLTQSWLTRDPTGEMVEILSSLEQGSAPRTAQGIWVSPDTQRALLVAQTRAAGSDLDAQASALDRLHSAFAAVLRSEPTSGRALGLEVSGPPVFAVAARATIKQEALRLSLISAGLIVILLLLVYRSIKALLLGLLPVLTGALAGIAAVELGFGVVHGITLGFGMTLIGESVDYSIYLFIQRGTPALWRTIGLGVLTSVCGFASLLPSGFPGLAQLGLYSVAGLLAAAAVTRWVLPPLLPKVLRIQDLTLLGTAAAAWLERARLARALLALVATLASLTLYLHRDTLWNRELSQLSPLPLHEQRLDAQLRAELNAPDVQDLVVVSATDAQSALRAAERVAVALTGLVNAGALAGFDSPANYLPSAATQIRRRASLPADEELRARLAQATDDLPLRAARLQPFLTDIARARRAPLLTPADLQGTSLASGYDALMMHAGGQWSALLPLRPLRTGAAATPIDIARVRSALAASASGPVLVLDLKQEADALYSGYLAAAVRLSLGGFAAIVVLLLLSLRSPVRVARIVAPLLLAVLTVAAVLLLAGRSLTILHLVGMLLIVAVGSNYALFFDRRAYGRQDGLAPLTLASLLIANATTVIGFGVLAFARVPVLAALGTTVAPGALLALVFSALLAPRAHARD